VRAERRWKHTPLVRTRLRQHWSYGAQSKPLQLLKRPTASPPPLCSPASHGGVIRLCCLWTTELWVPGTTPGAYAAGGAREVGDVVCAVASG
jgi:hypothetical protein